MCVSTESMDMTATALALAPDKWKGLSHAERRKFCKKRRRHHKRASAARKREAEEEEALKELQSSPGYFERLKEEARLEEERERKEEIERQYQHELWLRRETLAQVEFRKKRQAEERAAKAREEREKLIREEWEALQSKEMEDEEKKRVERERKEALLQEALSVDQQEPSEEPWRNPLAPTGATSSGMPSAADYGTEKDNVHCSFFLKTGACRFGDRCSRSHPRLTSSPTLLIPNMFQDIALVEQALEDRDNDVSLEFEEGELYERFKAFYDDVLPEFSRIGTVVQFKVCCNHEAHLRGNVYVQFSSEQECADAYKAFNGRWYAMRQLSCQFCPVVKWKTAICGQFQRRCCPKGRKCNFLHVFTNPGNAFWRADRDLPLHPSVADRHRWSERRGSGYRQRRRSVSPWRDRRRSDRHGSSSSSSRRHRRSGSRSGSDSDSDMETDTHHRAERTGGSQRSSSVASERSLQEHKRHSSHTKDDSFHDNHRRRHSSSSNKSNSHSKKRRKRESSQLSSDDSDHRGKRSKGKKRKKHRHSNKNSSPEHTEETN